MSVDYDVVIIGGGLAGASLAVALGGRQLRILVLEARALDHDQADNRAIALSRASRRIYETLDIWPLLRTQLAPIERIHISEQGRFAKVRLAAAEHGMSALAYVILARELRRALLERIRRLPGVEFISPMSDATARRRAGQVTVRFVKDGQARCVSTRLLALADGARSAMANQLGISRRVRDYGQRAFITRVMPEKPHRNIAFERFTPEGSLALLPLPSTPSTNSSGQHCMAIHLVAEDRADQLERWPERLLAGIQQRFGKRLGRLQGSGPVRSWPLALNLSEAQIQQRTVLLGNAAHTLHPNAAQGFNLCLRDIAELGDAIGHEQDRGGDIGRFAVLQEYYRRRAQDQRRIIRFTQGLHTLFYSHNPLKRLARHAVMLAVDAAPPLQAALLKQASGLAGRQPAAVSLRLID